MRRAATWSLLLALVGVGLGWPWLGPQLPVAQALLAPAGSSLLDAALALLTVASRAAWILFVPGLLAAAVVYQALRPPLSPGPGRSRPGSPPGSREPS